MGPSTSPVSRSAPGTLGCLFSAPSWLLATPRWVFWFLRHFRLWLILCALALLGALSPSGLCLACLSGSQGSYSSSLSSQQVSCAQERLGLLGHLVPYLWAKPGTPASQDGFEQNVGCLFLSFWGVSE